MHQLIIIYIQATDIMQQRNASSHVLQPIPHLSNYTTAHNESWPSHTDMAPILTFSTRK